MSVVSTMPGRNTDNVLARVGRRLMDATRLAARAAALLSRAGVPRTILRFQGGLGDQLLCSTVAHELARRGRSAVFVDTAAPELFEGNPDVGFAGPWPDPALSVAYRFHARAIELSYSRHDPDHVRDESPSEHILKLLCRRAGITGKVALRPYLQLRASELQHGGHGDSQIAIQSSGLSARHPMHTKEWYPERYQQVVDALGGSHTLVQIGAPGDPPLHGVIDLRGKTSPRQAAAVLARSKLFIGQVGFPMHLARAVDRRAVILYGGREKPWQTGYTCNENLATDPHCSPCWLYTCPYQHECMAVITADQVLAAVQRQLARGDEPLAVEEAEIA